MDLKLLPLHLLIVTGFIILGCALNRLQADTTVQGSWTTVYEGPIEDGQVISLRGNTEVYGIQSGRMDACATATILSEEGFTIRTSIFKDEGDERNLGLYTLGDIEISANTPAINRPNFNELIDNQTSLPGILNLQLDASFLAVGEDSAIKFDPVFSQPHGVDLGRFKSEGIWVSASPPITHRRDGDQISGFSNKEQIYPNSLARGNTFPGADIYIGENQYQHNILRIETKLIDADKAIRFADHLAHGE